MTLHWWMHWFWITYIAITNLSEIHSTPLVSTVPPENTPFTDETSNHSRALRTPKAIGFISHNAETPHYQYPVGTDIENIPDEEIRLYRPSTTTPKLTSVSSTNNVESKDVNKEYKQNTTNSDTLQSTNKTGFLNNATKFQLIINKTLQNETKKLLFVPKDVLEAPAITNTTVSGLKDVVLSLNETDNNSTAELIPDESAADMLLENVQFDSEEQPEITSKFTERIGLVVSNSETAAKGQPNLNAAAITGIAFGVLVTAALVSAVSFVLYRRRYLNKPQTLNDKCSNPDSSGYIDDSTMRENSEEMYSLDNDSFLNSLEAMTIQNYWTDSVKHTKL